MNIKAGLFQQQSLKLAMTQELSQAITLLQYSTQELTSFLESKSMENPLIVIDHTRQHSYNPRINKRKTGQGRDPKAWIEQISDDHETLENYLISQLNFQQLSKMLLKAVQYLIHSLDENGYLRMDLSDIAKEKNWPEELVHSALSILQSLQPAGIGARSLQECLLIQLRGSCWYEAAEQILSGHFILFAEKKWKELSKQTGLSLLAIQEVFDFIQSLNPRPGSAFAAEKPGYIVPDVIVECINGEYLVGTYDATGSKLTLNQEYYQQMKTHKDQQVNQFIQEKMQEFQWIARSIQQRKETIVKVMSKIVEKQPHCFSKGLSHLKPMTMKEIAEELGIHESTVSRAVKEKFVQAPFGTVEMRAFFSTNLQTVSEDDISVLQAKKELQSVIDNEDKTKPLSDQDISEILKGRCGIVLSRRTVAKYRDQLGIPSSSKRKRYK
ncbi:RNA polymerase sigma-54 factor [Peribacillus saganii]|uniref:RNA polymerase sigma-54 factor n=1 Tax=Peribacillus saganii TaxID=2303992 RepID=A0A372LM78_9BACI|nr:RNA polymerase factor sigma-54 [Peribacillus saganii]RFU66996.1 RNA polymerase sigma-54 factor [Peribacillus saganii]